MSVPQKPWHNKKSPHNSWSYLLLPELGFTSSLPTTTTLDKHRECFSITPFFSSQNKWLFVHYSGLLWVPCKLCWNYLILKNGKCEKEKNKRKKKACLMRELSLSSTYVFWIRILDLLSIIFQDSSSYSLQVLNLNFNFLPQSAHTQRVTGSFQYCTSKKGKVKK